MMTGNALPVPAPEPTGGDGPACRAFLARHSAYLDGELTLAERRAHEAHEANCAGCGRYASVLRRGTAVLRALPDITPAGDFRERLQRRIWRAGDDLSRRRGRRRWAVRAGAAAAVAVLAGSSWLLGRASVEPSAPVPAARPEVAAEPYSGARASSWGTPAVPLPALAEDPAAAFAVYSPVVVQQPRFRPVEYRPVAGE